MGIQAAGRFICQHHCRMIDESTGHRHTLLLTSRQLIRLVGGPFGKPHEFKNFRSRLLGFLLSSILFGKLVGFIVMVCLAAVGIISIYVKQRSGLHSKKRHHDIYFFYKMYER